MNKAESERLGSYLRMAGYAETAVAEDADLVVLNTCVVRRSAEERVLNKLAALRPVRSLRPGQSLAVTGCFAGAQLGDLQRQFPHVDLFFPPGELGPLAAFLGTPCAGPSQDAATARSLVSSFVPIMQGCDNFCTYCIVPYRRGRERSRPVDEIRCEVQRLVERGASEVTLVGQNVNSYGRGLPGNPDLPDLLVVLSDVRGLQRIRFLTNHPKDMGPRLVDTMISLGKVCQHLNIPVQSGDDDVLRAMRRGYTVADYLRVTHEVRRIPGLGLSTDVIVGFPGETDARFEHTLELLGNVRFDAVHVAAYSQRDGTAAARILRDDVSAQEKKRRLQEVERLQERVAADINSRLVGEKLEVLVERRGKGKWEGRTRSDKPVFFPDGGDSGIDLTGEVVFVRIDRATAWSLQGVVLAGSDRVESVR